MKKIYTLLAAAVLAVSAQAEPYSHSAFVTTSEPSEQESTAVEMFMTINPKGTVIEAKDLPTADLNDFDALWIHVDRVNIGAGNLPADFTPEVINAIQAYHQRGGGLLLTKQANKLINKIGRVEDKFAVNINDEGNGGNGTDVWAINPQLGVLCNVEGFGEFDTRRDEYTDRSSHVIFKDLNSFNWSCTLENKNKEQQTFEFKVYGLLGTGNGTEMFRWDHNCMWDLNRLAFNETTEGRNNMEKFQNETHSVVLGTWGHVVDFAVAAVVEFLPLEKAATMAEGDAQPGNTTGTILAIGPNAYELPLADTKNGSAENVRQFTQNALLYLAPLSDASGVADIETEDADAPVQYFNLQGIECAGELPAGIYIRRCGNTVSKVVVK